MYRSGSGTLSVEASTRNHPRAGRSHSPMILPTAPGHPNAAHIHAGAAGKAGGVKVPLEAPKADGTAKSCATVDRELLQQIVYNPSDYYVNVHNAEYPNGALRGQLTK
jgi:hypothetical protein